MPSDVEVVVSLFRRWAGGERSVIEALFDPAVVYRRVGAQVVGAEGSWSGREAVMAAVGDYIRNFASVGEEIESVEESDDRVLVIARQRTTGRVSGVPLDHRIGHVFTLRDGRVVDWVSYWDAEDALAALARR